MPCLEHDGLKVWDTLAIGEYVAEVSPRPACCQPTARRARIAAPSAGRCIRASANLRSALPMNLKAHHPGFKVWAGAQADIDRIVAIWSECLAAYGGPYLFGESLTMADAMYAPVVTRFLTYDVRLNRECAAYCRTIMKWPAMVEWVADAKAEPAELEELDMEF